MNEQISRESPPPTEAKAANGAKTATAAAIAVPATLSSMSKPRKLMLAALGVHLLSLFMTYQDESASGDVPILWNTGKIVHFQNTTPEQTGFQLKPYAIFVIAGLFAAFAKKFYENPIWRRYGYWISLVLLLVFAFGGAPFRTAGGWLSIISLGLVIYAAFANGKLSKRQPTT